MTLKETILAADDRQLQRVHVPEWATDVYLRVMTGLERDGFDNAVTGPDGKVVDIGIREQLLVRCLCDETGLRAFADADTAILAGKSTGVTQPLFIVAQKLNKLRAEDVATLEKN